MDFNQKLRVCDEDVMRPEYIISYQSLFQQDMQKYCNLVDSKRREPANRKENYQDEPLIMNDSLIAR